MTTFKVSITINQPVDIVTDALMNPDNFPYWQTDLVKFEVIERKPGEVGSIGLLHYSQKGKSYVMEDKLIYCEPGKKYVSQVTSDVLTARVETILQSSDNKTEMTLIWEGQGRNIILKLLLPLLRNKMIKQSRTELGIFKNLIETKGSNFCE
ncbi:MAG: hypothetical protein AMS27_13660 [Bacteroides sp. SM23_62_1]|nr:MAG: hypothetical protein AMS27_13660 [Bacteroides sp. SM23_62_1]